MKRKHQDGGEGGSWMDTYGDLVTLLLTFFILLYSMSSIDSSKWDLFVRSIYPNGRPGTNAEQQVVLNEKVSDTQEAEGIAGDAELPEEELSQSEINQLYLQLAEALNAAGVDGVSISRGTDYTFVVFRDKTFFDGDSSVLTQQGQETLEIFCRTIARDRALISQVHIMGHTAQGDPERANTPRNDRMLSVMRAAEVCLFIQSQDAVEPSKLISTGFGQFRPVADNSTSEGRAKNRRVEILLIDEGADVKDLNHYFQEYYSGKNKDTTIVTDGNKDTTIVVDGNKE